MTDLITRHIHTVPDFPTPGIMFRDITPLLGNPEAFQQSVDLMVEGLRTLPGGPPDAVVGIESRGFLWGVPVALALKLPFVPIRKPGKLPRKMHRAEYAKEYGVDALELHVDALKGGARVAVVDDVLATGGTALAAAELVGKAGARVAALAFLIELDFLQGRAKMPHGAAVISLVHY